MTSPASTTTTFAELGVPAPIVDVLAADGKTTAFPIQVDTLPDTLVGRDVLGRGKTGSGKTLAFAIPMVARLAAGSKNSSGGPTRSKGRPRALVLAPTRELATQIDAVLAPIAAAYGLRTTTIFGGINQTRQVNALRAGVDIVVACPGRLEDLMKQRHVSLDAVEITVLDEADHMADLGFLPGVTRIMTSTPERGQRLLFSATLDNGVDKLVRRFLHDQVLHSVDEANSPVAAMTHHVFEVADPDAKKQLVHKLASGTGRRILFMRTKHQAKRLAKQLTEAGVPSVDLHGNLSQPQRDRNLAAFSSGSARVLVATDVAARGVHVDDVELVIHVDPPSEHKAYLHRSGRTARAGSDGDVVTISLPSERRDLAQLLRKAAIKTRPVPVHAESVEVTDLVGEIAPFVEPVLRPATPDGGGRSGGGGGGRGGRGGQGGGRGRGGQGRGQSSDRAQGGRSEQGGSRGGSGRKSQGAGNGSRRGSNGSASGSGGVHSSVVFSTSTGRGSRGRAGSSSR